MRGLCHVRGGDFYRDLFYKQQLLSGLKHADNYGNSPYGTHLSKRKANCKCAHTKQYYCVNCEKLDVMVTHMIGNMPFNVFSISW